MLSQDQLHAALRGLEGRGVVRYQAADRSGGVELIRPGQTLTLDEANIKERRKREMVKLGIRPSPHAVECWGFLGGRCLVGPSPLG